jgi:cell wall-associated NlpC family hydrolase
MMWFGALCFYGKPEDITHVGVALTQRTMIEAGGGGSKTLTLEDAIKQNALVRLRPIRRRSDLVAVIAPAAVAGMAADDMALMRDMAIRLLGTPYRWAGDDPLAGFDCSGLAIELYTSFGLWDGRDVRAQDLYRHFRALAGSRALLGA